MAMYNKPAGNIAAISCNLTAKNVISADVKDAKTITFSKIKQAENSADDGLGALFVRF